MNGRPASSSWALAVRAMLTSTSGGSIDTDVNEFTVMPWRFVAPSKVTIATPVANRPRLPRKWLARGADSRPWTPPAWLRGVAIIVDPLRSVAVFAASRAALPGLRSQPCVGVL